MKSQDLFKQKIPILALVLLMIFFSHCSYRRSIEIPRERPASAISENLHIINKYGANRTTTLFTQNNEKFSCQDIYVTLDTCFALVNRNAQATEPKIRSTNENLTLPNTAVKKIVSKNSTAGATIGFIAGAAIGGTLGALYGLLDYGNEDPAPVGVRMSIGGLILGSLGGQAGLTMGTIFQGRDIFQFNPELTAFKGNTIPYLPLDSSSEQQLNQLIEMKTVSVLLNDFQEFKTKRILVKKDSTFWSEGKTYTPFYNKSVETGKIHRISFSSPKSARGCLIGSLCALPIGIIVGLLAEQPSDHMIRATRGALSGIFIGGSLGIMAGYFFKDRQVICLQKEKDAIYFYY